MSDQSSSRSSSPNHTQSSARTRSRSRSRTRSHSRQHSLSRPGQNQQHVGGIPILDHHHDEGNSDSVDIEVDHDDNNDEDDNDSDWNEDVDVEGEGLELPAGSNAAAIFSTILGQIGGASHAGQINQSNIRQILQGLTERGLLHEDEDGNLVMLADDEDIEGLEEEEGMEEDEDEEGKSEDAPPEIQKNEDGLDEYANYAQLHRQPLTKNVVQSLQSWEINNHSTATPTSHLVAISAQHIPSTCTSSEQFLGSAFCGKFSHGGGRTRFAAATQDGFIHLYEADDWKLYKQIQARQVNWSIVDVDFSNDSRFVIYSSWSDSVHLINAEGEFELHEALQLEDPGGRRQTCMFGIRFSPNGSREILAGLNQGLCILYDIERKRRLWKADAHDDDINSVCWLDDNLFATGSDDTTIRIWDRRLLSNSDEDDSSSTGAAPIRRRAAAARATPVGGFLGHVYGLTCVAPLPDGNARYLLSNSKDQSMKLWDVRRMLPPDVLSAGARRSATDYRWQSISRRDLVASGATSRRGAVDTSVITFTGHSIARTLVRCDFSPQHSTGCRYAITGSSNGVIYIYDILTGEIVKQIEGHQAIVRDVAWQDHLIVSSSWDHSIHRHALHKEKLHNNSVTLEGYAQRSMLRRRAQFAQQMEEEEEEED